MEEPIIEEKVSKLAITATKLEEGTDLQSDSDSSLEGEDINTNPVSRDSDSMKEHLSKARTSSHLVPLNAGNFYGTSWYKTV